MQDWILKSYKIEGNKLHIIARNLTSLTNKNISGPGINLTSRIVDSKGALLIKEKEFLNMLESIFKNWDGKSSISNLIEENIDKKLGNNSKDCLDFDLLSSNLGQSMDMNNNEVLYAEELKELRTKIAWYNDNYAQLRNTAENGLQDVRLERLKELCPNDPLLDVVNSDLVPNLPKIRHRVPMLSLEKITADSSKLNKWVKKFKTKEIIVQPKLDGHSLAIHYKGGNHVLSVTRGNKVEGNDVTINSRYIKGIPLKINDIREIEIRGEDIIKNSDFESLKGIFENTRNAISIAKVQDPKDLENKRLSFIAYNLLVDGQTIYNEDEKYKLLKEFGFEVPYYRLINRDAPGIIEEILEEFELYRTENSPLDYATDGIVFKVNSYQEQQEVGENDHDPNWAVAYKYLAEEKTTTIQSIEWTVSKNGNVIPVGILKPVKLSGTTVSRVTLHNMKFVEDNLVFLEDEILLRKSGEIIPYFIENVTELEKLAKLSKVTADDLRNRISLAASQGKELTLQQIVKELGLTTIEIGNKAHSINEGRLPIPDACPSCSHFLRKSDIHLYCANETCFGRNKKELVHFVESLEIDSLGEGLITKLFTEKVIKTPEDILLLTPEKLTGVPGFQEGLINKVLMNINFVKENISLTKLLKAVGIEALGERKSKDLLSIYGTIGNMVQSINEEELLRTPGFGSVNSVYFTKLIKEKAKDITNLAEICGVLNKQYDNGVKENKLDGATFCITGTLSRNRNDIEKDIISMGGKIASVTSKLNYLVVGSGGGSKQDKAMEINDKKPGTIKILTEEELTNLLN